MFRVLGSLPLLSFAALIYFGVALFAGDGVEAHLAAPVMTLPMASGASWHLSLGGFIVTLALILFFIDVLRAATPTRRSMGRNIAQVLVFIPFLILFLLVRPFGTTEFFLIVLMLCLSFMADATLLVLTSRRSMEIEHD
jgi:hypothetical protein